MKDEFDDASKDFAEAVEGIRRGYEGVKVGRARPGAEVFDELRRKYDFPKDVSQARRQINSGHYIRHEDVKVWSFLEQRARAAGPEMCVREIARRELLQVGQLALRSVADATRTGHPGEPGVA